MNGPGVLQVFVRLSCLMSATASPVIAAGFCRRVSEIAVDYLLPTISNQGLPAFTEFWIAGVAKGSPPLMAISLVISALVAASGGFVLFSKKLSHDLSGTAFTAICSVGLSVGLMALGSTLLALVIPLIPVR
jgi:hypothetical protein